MMFLPNVAMVFFIAKYTFFYHTLSVVELRKLSSIRISWTMLQNATKQKNKKNYYNVKCYLTIL